MKRRLFLLIIILFVGRSLSLLAQEGMKCEDRVITAEGYSLFLQENQRIEVDSERESLIICSGEPGDYDIEVQLGKKAVPMSFLSWDDALAYCDWINRSQKWSENQSDIITNNVLFHFYFPVLSFCGGDLSAIDPFLKSNRFTLHLLKDEGANCYQAGGAEVTTLCDGLVEDILEAAFGLVGLGTYRLGSLRQEREEQREGATASLDGVPEGFWLRSHATLENQRNSDYLLQLKETCAAREEDSSMTAMNKVGPRPLDYPAASATFERKESSEIPLKGAGKKVTFGDTAFVQVISEDQVPFTTAIQEVPFSEELQKFIPETGTTESKEASPPPRSEVERQWKKYHRASFNGWKVMQSRIDDIFKDEEITPAAKRTAIALIYEKNYSRIKTLLKNAIPLIKNNEELQNSSRVRALTDFGVNTLFTAARSVAYEKLRSPNSEEEAIDRRALGIRNKLTDAAHFLGLSDEAIVEKKKAEAQQAFNAVTKAFAVAMGKKRTATPETLAQAKLEYQLVSKSFDECKSRLDAVEKGDPKEIAEAARKSVIDEVLSIIEVVEEAADHLQQVFLARKIE